MDVLEGEGAMDAFSYHETAFINLVDGTFELEIGDSGFTPRATSPSMALNDEMVWDNDTSGEPSSHYSPPSSPLAADGDLDKLVLPRAAVPFNVNLAVPIPASFPSALATNASYPPIQFSHQAYSSSDSFKLNQSYNTGPPSPSSTSSSSSSSKRKLETSGGQRQAGLLKRRRLSNEARTAADIEAELAMNNLNPDYVEHLKFELRLAKNRESAYHSRERKKKQENELNFLLVELRNENQQLKDRIKLLEGENVDLRAKLVYHQGLVTAGDLRGALERGLGGYKSMMTLFVLLFAVGLVFTPSIFNPLEHGAGSSASTQGRILDHSAYRETSQQTKGHKHPLSRQEFPTKRLRGVIEETQSLPAPSPPSERAAETTVEPKVGPSVPRAPAPEAEPVVVSTTGELPAAADSRSNSTPQAASAPAQGSADTEHFLRGFLDYFTPEEDRVGEPSTVCGDLSQITSVAPPEWSANTTYLYLPEVYQVHPDVHVESSDTGIKDISFFIPASSFGDQSVALTSAVLEVKCRISDLRGPYRLEGLESLERQPPP